MVVVCGVGEVVVGRQMWWWWCCVGRALVRQCSGVVWYRRVLAGVTSPGDVLTILWPLVKQKKKIHFYATNIN